MKEKKFIVFDLDGTLRDTEGSEGFIPVDVTKTEYWISWQNWVNAFGVPNNFVVEGYKKNIKACASREDREVLILTSSMFGTREWLFTNNLPQPDRVIERDTSDNRSPFYYKKHYIDSHKEVIQLWIDDDMEVCDYVESLGIEVRRVYPRNTEENQRKFFEALNKIEDTELTPAVVSEYKSKANKLKQAAKKKDLKFDHDKPMYDLLPPLAIDEMAKVMTMGAEKYEAHSWKTVKNGKSRYLAALLRHAFAIVRGELVDPESGLPHAAHIMCNAAFLVELQKEK